MSNDKGSKTSSLEPDTSRIEKLLSENTDSDNPLLTALKDLYQSYLYVSGRLQTLAKEKTQLEQQMVNINRSLDLATRVDPLTGLANRRSIMEKIDQEFSRAQRHQRSLSVVLVDIDNYKAVNDKHGLNAGDDVLVELARVLRCSMRSEDICARWGGEEFLILLPETTTEGALSLANKIRDSIDMTEFRANRPGIHITVSMGICEYSHDMNILECINKAEQALCKAKSAGKNRAVLAS